jgi:hypothetical protein
MMMTYVATSSAAFLIVPLITRTELAERVKHDHLAFARYELIFRHDVLSAMVTE